MPATMWAAAAAATLALAGPPSAGSLPPASTPASDEVIARWIADTDPLITSAIDQARATAGEGDTPEDRRRRYDRMLAVLMADPALDPVLAPPSSVLQALKEQQPNIPPAQRAAFERSVASEPSLLARSVDAAATNPRRIGLVERSGLIDVVALALQGTNFVVADDSAVTLSLNAAALLKRVPPETSDVEAYQRRGFLNRLGGSVTFGARIPEKEITGLTDLPPAERLFDVVVWDVKLRLIGDRDPRAERWDRLLRGELAGRSRVLARVRTHPAFPLQDAQADGPLALAVSEAHTAAAREAKGALARSWQVSVKASGQHLTTEKGKNKYSASLLADKGLGALDFTVNATYSVAQEVPASQAIVDLKTWTVAAGLTGTIWKEVLVAGVGTELSLTAEGTFPDNEAGSPERKRIHKVDLAFRLPVSTTVRVPVSVTWTNDPNTLEKQRFFKGQIGINYDFGSLKKLLGAAGGQAAARSSTPPPAPAE